MPHMIIHMSDRPYDRIATCLSCSGTREQRMQAVVDALWEALHDKGVSWVGFYVERPGTDRPTYEGREIRLGPRAGDVYIVRSGLAEGERVVVEGNFKIDSSLQIQAQPSMMSEPGDAPAQPGSHAH